VTWLFTLLAMAVIALVVGVVTGRITASMEPPATSLPFLGLVGDDVRPADLEQVRFDAALRGYRMDQVDGVLDRLAEELARRDDEIAALRFELAQVLGEPGPRDPVAPPPSPYGDLGASYPAEGGYGPAYIPPSGGIELSGWPERDRD
jgi:DivIVA domain-containing protein